VAFAPGVDHLVGDHQQGGDDGGEQQRGGATGAVKAGGDALDGGSGVLGADHARVFGWIVNVCKIRHLVSPFLALVATLPGE